MRRMCCRSEQQALVVRERGHRRSRRWRLGGWLRLAARADGVTIGPRVNEQSKLVGRVVPGGCSVPDAVAEAHRVNVPPLERAQVRVSKAVARANTIVDVASGRVDRVAA